MHRRTILSVVLVLVVGCSVAPPSMDAVQNEIIPLPAFAAGAVYEEHTNEFNRHTIITTYTTTRSTLEI